MRKFNNPRTSVLGCFALAGVLLILFGQGTPGVVEAGQVLMGLSVAGVGLLAKDGAP